MTTFTTTLQDLVAQPNTLLTESLKPQKSVGRVTYQGVSFLVSQHGENGHTRQMEYLVRLPGSTEAVGFDMATSCYAGEVEKMVETLYEAAFRDEDQFFKLLAFQYQLGWYKVHSQMPAEYTEELASYKFPSLF